MSIINFKITRPDITQDLKKGKLTDNKRSILLKKGQLRLNSLPRNAMQKVNIRRPIVSSPAQRLLRRSRRHQPTLVSDDERIYYLRDHLVDHFGRGGCNFWPPVVSYMGDASGVILLLLNLLNRLSW